MKTLRFIGSIFAFVGLVFLLVGLGMSLHNLRFQNRAVSSTGKVIDFKEHWVRGERSATEKVLLHFYCVSLRLA